jgi:hypothetical protein
MKLLIMKFSTLHCYLVPLRPKYSSQHILKHPQAEPATNIKIYMYNLRLVYYD